MANSLENLDNLKPTPSQTDRPRKQGFGPDEPHGASAEHDRQPKVEQLGQADGLDPDGVGDIADEGTGRRG